MTNINGSALYTFIGGMLYLLAGLAGLIRHFLLEPHMTNYPKAPSWLLHVFFFFSVVLIYLGTRLLNLWMFFNEFDRASAPFGMPTWFIMAVGIAAYNGSMMVNVMQQRLPSRIWDRINSMNERARCRSKD